MSAEFVDLSRRQVIASIAPGLRLIPASVTKLYTTAAALQQWGAAHTFTTRVLAHGRLRDGVLHGDITLVGGGDPTLDYNDLAQLAKQLHQRGLRRILGHVRVDDSLFGPVSCATPDRCAARHRSRNSYNAPLSAAGVDFSNASVLVQPGAVPGAPARVGLYPFDLPMLHLESRVKTTKAGEPSHLQLTRVTRDGHDLLTLSGHIAVDAQAQFRYCSVSDPVRFSGQMLVASLRQAGIQVGGGIRHKQAPADARELASVQGKPLGEQLREMLTYSNNYIADTLALDLLQAAGAKPPLDLRNAGERLAQLGRTIDQATAFKGTAGSERTVPPLTLDSGSGLTVANRLSAADLVALLDREYRRFGDFPSFLGALTVPDQTPVKFLGEQGDHAWQTRIAAKTGSLNDPYPVYSLAGYFRFRNGDWGAFAVLINAGTDGPPIDRNHSLDAIRDTLERLLASR